MTITIFLIADDEPADRLLGMVADWTAAGLLAESMWVRTGEWQRGERALHDVGVEVLSGTARQSHLLLPLLGPRRIGHVRLVVVHLAVSPAHPDTPLTGAARALVGLLGSRLPADTGITVLNVMVPSSETGQLPRGMLLELPTTPVVNIAVSPEDRRSDAHADIAVRNGARGNFTGHAVLGCVTVAGLWRGVGSGPLDTSSLASAFDEDVVVARTFASLVWSGAVVDEVSAHVLAPRATWPHPRTSAGPERLTEDPAAAVDLAAARCRDLGGGVLRWRPAPRPAPAARRRVGLLRLVPGAAGFVVARMWRPPADLAIHATPAVLERATRLARAGTDLVAAGAGPGPASGGGETLDDLAGQARALLTASGEAEGGRPERDAGGAGPAVWDQVRSVAFALVDGAEPVPGEDNDPAGPDPLAGVAGVAEGMPADLIAPDPWAADTAAVERGVAAIWLDPPAALAGGGPFEARRLRAALESLTSGRDLGHGPGEVGAAAVAGRTAEPGAARPAPDRKAGAAPPPATAAGIDAGTDAGTGAGADLVTRPDVGAAGETTGADLGAGPGGATGAGADLVTRPDVGAAGETTGADLGARPGGATDVEATVAALDAWTGRRSGSVLWKVSEGLADDIGAARQEMADGVSALGRPPEVTGSRALRRMWATCRRTCVTAILLAVALIVGYRLGGLSSSDFLVATVSTVVVAVLAATVAFWRYRRVEVGLANAIARDRTRFETGFAQAAQGATEVVRLVGLYRELQDWSTVIGALAHRPFGVPPARRPASAPPLGAGLAMACNVAEGQASDEQIRWLSAGATATVFAPGWLGLAYDDLVASLPTRSGRSPEGRGATDGALSPPGTDGALVSVLSDTVMAGGFAGWGYRRGRAQVAAFCLAQPVRRLVSEVTPAQPEVDADGPVAGDLAVDAFVACTLPSPGLQQFLLGELWSETGRVRRSHRVERMIMWGPAGVAGAGAGDDPAEWFLLPNVEGPDGQLVLRVIRLDCSTRTPSRDLRLFTSVVTPVSRA